MRNILSDAQLKAEFSKCEFCEEKPCKEACPVDCSPADFIMAARRGLPQDFTRSAAIIMGSNPLGGVCGYVCPDYHCKKACVHRTFDNAVDIPPVQATIIKKAKELGKMPEFLKAKSNGKKIAIIGAGPSGLGACSVLIQKGYKVDIFEKDSIPGGMCNLIPDIRLDKNVLQTDIEFLKTLGDVNIITKTEIKDLSELKKNYDAVIVSSGLDKEIHLSIKGEEKAFHWIEYLKNRKKINLKGLDVAVIGGGAVALDAAITAKSRGAKYVEMICLEKFDEMPLTDAERNHILEFGIGINGRTKVDRIEAKKTKSKREGDKTGIDYIITSKVVLPAGKKFHPTLIKEDKFSNPQKRAFDAVIIAIGSKPSFKIEKQKGVFYAGDMINGPTTVVEAVASGKNIAVTVDAFINNLKKPSFRKAKSGHLKSRVILDGKQMIPVPIDAEFFGRKILSPFLLSAAPPSDGYEQMKKAYEAGWAGGVMKTAFDNVDIHIPSEYMFAVTKSTYGNCDNVSGHPLNRVCSEIERLVKEFPDRLTLASTGGPVTGYDENDRAVWVSNSKKLENAGAMGIEYSLSCPQGGDGTKGDIVSQDPDLTAKIIDWVMEASDPDIPKLFKLTAAVTSIYPILSAINNVFEKYPNKKAGVTLANTFPALAFRKGKKEIWEEGIVIGLSGEGVIPISNLTLANAARHGITVSGNGGPMDYKSAADFLALGAKTVQFCTIVMKNGYHIIDDLHSGLSYLLKERGFNSVKELIGCALPNPITGFGDLSPIKKISDVNSDLCEHCGNCTRCPYLAITLNKKSVPETDASKCIGCSICVQKCFAGALFMRERTKEELELLSET